MSVQTAHRGCQHGLAAAPLGVHRDALAPHGRMHLIKEQ